MIQGLKYVVLATSDLDSTRSFFETVMGRPVNFQDGSRWAEFKFGAGSRIAVASLDEAGSPHSCVVPVLESDDLDADVARLAAAGVVPTATRDMGPHGRIVVFASSCGPFQLFGRGARTAAP